jgi:neutral ceramidase
MRIGISEVNITPAPGLPRAGMPNPQPGQGTAWPLMGRVFVLDDGTRRVALITLDLLFLHPETVAELRCAIAPGTGLAPENILIACTHTHWGPHTTAIMDEDANFDYLDFLRARLSETAAKAVANLQPGQIKSARIPAQGWAFNRRPLYRTAQGEQVGTQGPRWIDSFVRMEGPADPELGILLFEGPDGKPLGGLVNFACHTTTGPDEPFYSADYPGPLTELLSSRLGGIYGFLQGCAGNIWQTNMTRARTPLYQENGSGHTRRMGEALAEKALEALPAARLVVQDTVHMAARNLRIPQRRPTREQVQLAKWFLESRPAGADLQEHMLKIYGHPYTFYSDLNHIEESDIQGGILWQEDWFARGLLGIWEQQRRSGTRELLEDVEVQAIALGDVVIVAYPAEYFSEFGLQTKARSPFPDTFVSELSNGWHGYVPTREAFRHGGYEPRLGDASRLVEEAGDLLCEAGIGLTWELWRQVHPDFEKK